MNECVFTTIGNQHTLSSLESVTVLVRFIFCECYRVKCLFSILMLLQMTSFCISLTSSSTCCPLKRLLSWRWCLSLPIVPISPTTTGTTLVRYPGFILARSAARSWYRSFFSFSLSAMIGSHAHATSCTTSLLSDSRRTTMSDLLFSTSLSVGQFWSTCTTTLSVPQHPGFGLPSPRSVGTWDRETPRPQNRPHQQIEYPVMPIHGMGTWRAHDRSFLRRLRRRGKSPSPCSSKFSSAM